MLRSLAAGGVAGGYLGFTSHARRPCVLHGWPTLAGLVMHAHFHPRSAWRGSEAYPASPDAIGIGAGHSLSWPCRATTLEHTNENCSYLGRLSESNG